MVSFSKQLIFFFNFLKVHFFLMSKVFSLLSSRSEIVQESSMEFSIVTMVSKSEGVMVSLPCFLTALLGMAGMDGAKKPIPFLT